eukprot:gene39674-49225_t
MRRGALAGPRNCVGMMSGDGSSSSRGTAAAAPQRAGVAPGRGALRAMKGTRRGAAGGDPTVYHLDGRGEGGPAS